MWPEEKEIFTLRLFFEGPPTKNGLTDLTLTWVLCRNKSSSSSSIWIRDYNVISMYMYVVILKGDSSYLYEDGRMLCSFMSCVAINSLPRKNLISLYLFYYTLSLSLCKSSLLVWPRKIKIISWGQIELNEVRSEVMIDFLNWLTDSWGVVIHNKIIFFLPCSTKSIKSF